MRFLMLAIFFSAALLGGAVAQQRGESHRPRVPFNVKDWYWAVATVPDKVFSSKRAAYVATADEQYVAWTTYAEHGPTPIANEVLLNDVLLHRRSTAALKRTFTPAEVIKTLRIIDNDVVTSIIGDATDAAPNDPRLASLLMVMDLRVSEMGN